MTLRSAIDRLARVSLLAVPVGLAPRVSFTPPPAARIATVRVEENVRAKSNGSILGHVLPGSRLAVVGHDGRRLEIELRGGVRTPSPNAADLSLPADAPLPFPAAPAEVRKEPDRFHQP